MPGWSPPYYPPPWGLPSGVQRSQDGPFCLKLQSKLALPPGLSSSRASPPPTQCPQKLLLIHQLSAQTSTPHESLPDDLSDRSRSPRQILAEPWNTSFMSLSSGHPLFRIRGITPPPSHFKLQEGGPRECSACQCIPHASSRARGVCESLLNPHASLLYPFIWFDFI